MSGSDEDFSLVVEPLAGESLADVTAMINKFQKQHEQLLEEQKELASTRDDRRELTAKFKERRDRNMEMMREDELAFDQQLAQETLKCAPLEEEGRRLREQIQQVEEALKEEEKHNLIQTERNAVFATLPHREVFFSGFTGDPKKWEEFEMKSDIIYPMEGGTALVTFEEEEVAKEIVSKKHHLVDLSAEFSIALEAFPLHLMLPSSVEIDTEVCPRRILVSNLPDVDDADALLNKLEIHFSKSKHGGGEVEECELLPDSGNVVITFISNDVAKGLTETEHHDVFLSKRKHRVRVTPFLNGHITHFKAQTEACRRTVLLRGIPAVMEQELLQDHLEIYFQKSQNDGGEIESFCYNPEGRSMSARFGEAAATKEEEQEE